MDDQVKVLVCMRVADMRCLPASGSRVTQCSSCREDVYVTTASPIAAGSNAQTLCLRCARGVVGKDEQDKVLGTDVQRREMEKETGRKITDEQYKAVLKDVYRKMLL